MTSYNFLKEANVHIVFNNYKYSIGVKSVSFNQTFTEESYAVRTLHAPTDVFEGSVINKASPANFEFAISLLREDDLEIVFYLLTKYKSNEINMNSFDLYVSTKLDLFRLEKCVITNGSFVIEKSQPLSLTVSGEAAKLSHVGTASGNTIPGTEVARSATRTYILNRDFDIRIGGTSVNDIISCAVELQNEITWAPYATLHNSLSVTDADNSMYPTDYTLEKRILSGSIQRYVTDSNSSDLQDWSTDTSFYISAGETVSGVFAGVELDMANCSFTNRLGVGQVFVQNHDWRLTQNVSDLETIVKYKPHYPINITN